MNGAEIMKNALDEFKNIQEFNPKPKLEEKVPRHTLKSTDS